MCENVLVAEGCFRALAVDAASAQAGERHYLAPDDDTPHAASQACPCRPRVLHFADGTLVLHVWRAARRVAGDTVSSTLVNAGR